MSDLKLINITEKGDIDQYWARLENCSCLKMSNFSMNQTKVIENLHV